ncbi:amidohydrolase [Phaeodactylibacter luteus]|uniref:Amidohydrolase n=2 Tax=Phaeodactylibacter luteus TaxID=1564516 RepID=A0A5C6RFJ7_9BACT|nr:amidohydrolase [Phaeodactylibacter luteus]
MKKRFLLLGCLLGSSLLGLSQGHLHERISAKAAGIERQVVEWRRHLHQYPELSNREFNTMAYIVDYMKTLPVEIESGVAHTGVVALLDTGKPGPTVALRADMDALPVRERVDVPFASKEETEYLGQRVGIMHACGHDSHVAMLMGAATVLCEMKEELNGRFLFVFQPAEEGAPVGEEGGAALMVKEGIIEKYGVDVFFGLHISSVIEEGTINYRPNGIMAAADQFKIKVKGKQTHGSRPWDGVDPIVVSAQIIMGLQAIISRQTDLTNEAAVITVGKITSGVRNNIVPEEAEMIGTIRTFDTAMQREIHNRIVKTATSIAEASGAEAEVDIIRGYPVTFNNPQLTAQMLPTLFTVFGEEAVRVTKPVTGAEDFSFFAREVPGLFFFLGARPAEWGPMEATFHHTPDFFISEGSFVLGVEALSQLAVDYMASRP